MTDDNRSDCLAEPKPKCIGGDPTCPCQDGDACHYVDVWVEGKLTKGWPIPGF